MYPTIPKQSFGRRISDTSGRSKRDLLRTINFTPTGIFIRYHCLLSDIGSQSAARHPVTAIHALLLQLIFSSNSRYLSGYAVYAVYASHLHLFAATYQSTYRPFRRYLSFSTHPYRYRILQCKFFHGLLISPHLPYNSKND